MEDRNNYSMKAKNFTILAVLGFASLTIHAQGTINFSNGAAGVNAPVSNNYENTLVSGSAFIAQLFAGPVGTAWDSLTPITPTATFGTGPTAGYFFGGLVVIPNVPAGSPAAFQVRVWSSNFATWDAAWAAYQQGDLASGIGVSGWNLTGLPTTVFVSPNLGGGPNPPPNLVGLQSFRLLVPEPSVFLLGLAGVVILSLRHFWFRHYK
jgi:hypothetical protein